MKPLLNYIGGDWRETQTLSTVPILDPATGECLAAMPLSDGRDVENAVRAAAEALPSWRRTPPGDRVQPLFRLKTLLDTHHREIAETITRECGKTVAESEAE